MRAWFAGGAGLLLAAALVALSTQGGGQGTSLMQNLKIPTGDMLAAISKGLAQREKKLVIQRLDEAAEGEGGDDEPLGGTKRDKDELKTQEDVHYGARKQAIDSALKRVQADVENGTPEGKAIAFEARHWLRWKAAKEQWEQSAYSDIASEEANRTDTEAGSEKLLKKYAEHADAVQATESYDALLHEAYAEDKRRNATFEESKHASLPTEESYRALMADAYAADEKRTAQWREISHAAFHRGPSPAEEPPAEAKAEEKAATPLVLKAPSKPASFVASSHEEHRLVDASLVVAEQSFEFAAPGMVEMRKGETARLVSQDPAKGVSEVVTSEGKMGLFPTMDLDEAYIEPPVPPAQEEDKEEAKAEAKEEGKEEGKAEAKEEGKEEAKEVGKAQEPEKEEGKEQGDKGGGKREGNKGSDKHAHPSETASDIPALHRAAFDAAVEAEKRIVARVDGERRSRKEKVAKDGDTPGHGWDVVAGAIAQAEGEFDRDEQAERARSRSHHAEAGARPSGKGAGGVDAASKAVASHYARFADALRLEREQSKARRVGGAKARGSKGTKGARLAKIEADADERIAVSEAASRERDSQEEAKLAEEEQEERVALKQAALMTMAHDGSAAIDQVARRYRREERGLEGLEKEEDVQRLHAARRVSVRAEAAKVEEIEEESRRIIARLLAKDMSSNRQ